jgi:hypothetical protein
MSRTRSFVDTTPVNMAELLARQHGGQVRRTDRIVNVLLAVAIGAGLAWWLWEWAVACTTALTCGLALVRPHPTTGGVAATNEERLHTAISAAHKAGHDAGYCAGFKAGHDAGYCAGFKAGARYGRVLHVGAGMLLGAALVAGMLKLGLSVGTGA